MHTPSASEMLQAWERGAGASAAARGLWLLDACCDDVHADALLALPLGRRDALLLELRERLFGKRVESVTQCPACGATVEASFDLDALRKGVWSNDDSAGDDVPTTRELRLSGTDRPIRFRLPDSRDLLAMQACDDAVSARCLLVQRCMIEVGGDSTDMDVPPLSHGAQAELARAMAEADPQADLALAFTCPDCRQCWEPMFDIARFLWEELHAWALHLLRDVDTLARSYHWSEAEILAMSPRRRQAYLEQCAS